MRTTPMVESTKKPGGPRPLIAYCLERPTLFFSIRMALVVGTLLAVINHGQAIIHRALYTRPASPDALDLLRAIRRGDV
jgi:hypothetical protein